ncbi:MAG: hypothetical protein JWO60_1541 [Frankiales bacterium]|nr:hypothetical protein [Frankiales bacterium]
MRTGSLRRLLTPGWLALHVVAVAAVVALAGLGRWQWQRGVELGRVQNYSYAVEWWLFTAFAVFLWVKTMADSLEERDAGDVEEPAAVPAPAALQVEDDDDDDPELAAYNRHLRELHARSQGDR